MSRQPARPPSARPRRPAHPRSTSTPTSAQPVGVLLLAGAVFALAALTLFELANWDKIAPGVTALGTPIGGLAQADAASRLAPSVQGLLDRPLEIHAAGQTWRTSARDLGLRLEPAELASTAYRVGRQGSPFDRLGDQLDSVLRGRSMSTASSTDQAALDASVTTMAHQVERDAIDARLSLAADGSVQSVPAAEGLRIDVPASREVIATALNARNTSSQSVDLVSRTIPPGVPDAQVQAARDQLGQLFGPDAQPLTVAFGQQTWDLARADLVKSITVQPSTQAGQPVTVKVDDAPLQAWAARLAKEVDQPVRDARFQFKSGALQVLTPSKQGRHLDQAATVQAVHAALAAGQAGTLPLTVATTEPSVSSDDPQALGITELIDKGSTSFAGGIPEKKHNIQLAAERLNGVVVAPGATFSFNDAVGPTTIDAGFQWGFGIASGDNGPRTVPSVAGGICQVATTLFQPVFWAGYPLEERYWHLYWIPAYTSRGVVGLDVTVDSDSNVDFKWTNPTSDYVLVQSASDNENVYFSLYGKKPKWKVEVDDAIISNRTPPDTKPIAQPEPTLPWGRTLAVETARDGFDAEVTRRVTPSDGSKPRTLDLKSTYEPAHNVTLVGVSGIPAGASAQDAVQRVLDAQKPKPTPNADPAAAPSPTAVAASDTSTQPGPAPTARPAATAAPAPVAPAPTSKPQAQATAAPTKAAAIAPTRTPAPH